MKISKLGYLERRTGGRAWRDWWLIKMHSNNSSGTLNFHTVSFPKHMVGKRIRFKLEIMENEDTKHSSHHNNKK